VYLVVVRSGSDLAVVRGVSVSGTLAKTVTDIDVSVLVMVAEATHSPAFATSYVVKSVVFVCVAVIAKMSSAFQASLEYQWDETKLGASVRPAVLVCVAVEWSKCCSCSNEGPHHPKSG